MNIAINPEAPEYVARITLKPRKEEDMKVTNHYKKTEGKWFGNLFFLYLAVIVVCALVGII